MAAYGPIALATSFAPWAKESEHAENTCKYEQISSLLLSKTSAFECNFSISFNLTAVVNSSNSFVSLIIFAASASFSDKPTTVAASSSTIISYSTLSYFF